MKNSNRSLVLLTSISLRDKFASFPYFFHMEDRALAPASGQKSQGFPFTVLIN